MQLRYFFVGGWWQNLHSGHRKTLHSMKLINITKNENPLYGSTSCAAALCRAAHRMMGLGQSLLDLHSLIGGKAWGKLPQSDCGGVWQSVAEVSSTKRWSAWINLRWSLPVDAWNVLFLREDDHLFLSSELQHLNIGIAALSEVQGTDSGEIMAVVSPTIGLVTLMVTMPKELLSMCPTR